MVFPGNFTEILNDKSVLRKSIDTKPVKYKDKRYLVDEFTENRLLTLSLKSYETGAISENLKGWTVTDTNSRLIVVKLLLAQPLLLS